MDTTIITTTERLRIEKAQLQDDDFFFRLLNSPSWIRYIGDRGIRTRDDAEQYIQDSVLESYQQHGYGLYKVVFKATGHPMGLCGFLKRTYLDHADIGFAILPEYERQGYTYEAARALLEYGATVLKLRPMLAITTSSNLRSRHLLAKLGLIEQGKIRPTRVGPEYLLFSTADS